MNKYNFDDIVNRYNTDAFKYLETNKDTLPMWVADMDFHVLPDIKEAIKARADLDAYGYVDVPKEYYLSYINWFKRHHDLEIDIKHCIYATGVIAALDSIFKHLLKFGDGLLLTVPVYHTFFHCIENNNLALKETNLIYENGEYRFDFDDFDAQISSGNIKAFLLCNPNNPTGLPFSLDDLNHIAMMCHKYHVLLISDEVHGDIAEPGYQYQPLLKVNKEYQDIVISLFSPSKAFNLASIHAAMVVVPCEELRKKVQEGLWADDVGEPSYFAIPATIAAYNNGDIWNKEMCEYVQKNKDYVTDYIAKHIPKLHVVKSHFSYLMWIDISKISNNALAVEQFLKSKYNVIISNGHQFRGNGGCFIRVNVATSFANVKEFCSRLEKLSKEHF